MQLCKRFFIVNYVYVCIYVYVEHVYVCIYVYVHMSAVCVEARRGSQIPWS